MEDDQSLTREKVLTLSVAQLKHALRIRNLPTNGRKEVLKNRLLALDSGDDESSDDSDDSGKIRKKTPVDMNDKEFEFATIDIPVGIVCAQLAIDYTQNRILIVGSDKNMDILAFNIKSQSYETDNASQLIPDYKAIEITPEFHSVTPLYDSNNELQCIVSFGGRNDHFCILERIDGAFQWNKTPLIDQSLPYPNVGHDSKSLNINNNIHIIGGRDFGNRYIVYNASRKCFIEYPKINTLRNFIWSHGLTLFGNRLILFGGYQNDDVSDGIHFIELSNTEMIGLESSAIDGANDGRRRWRKSKRKMPRAMSDFGYASIENSGLVIIVGGWGEIYETLASIYIFDCNALDDTKRNCFTELKQSLPEQMSFCNCVVVNRQLHIVGGSDMVAEGLNTHLIIDLDTIIPYLKSDQFKLIINRWIRMECRKAKMEIQIPLALMGLIETYTGYVCI